MAFCVPIGQTMIRKWPGVSSFFSGWILLLLASWEISLMMTGNEISEICPQQKWFQWTADYLVSDDEVASIYPEFMFALLTLLMIRRFLDCWLTSKQRMLEKRRLKIFPHATEVPVWELGKIWVRVHQYFYSRPCAEPSTSYVNRQGETRRVGANIPWDSLLAPTSCPNIPAV